MRVSFTLLVLKPMASRNALPFFDVDTMDTISPARRIKLPSGMYTFPARSMAPRSTLASLFLEMILLPTSITAIPSSILFSGSLILIISTCPLANELTSRAVGRLSILDISLAVSSSGFIIIVSPSFSHKYEVSEL